MSRYDGADVSAAAALANEARRAAAAREAERQRYAEAKARSDERIAHPARNPDRAPAEPTKSALLIAEQQRALANMTPEALAAKLREQRETRASERQARMVAALQATGKRLSSAELIAGDDVHDSTTDRVRQIPEDPRTGPTRAAFSDRRDDRSPKRLRELAAAKRKNQREAGTKQPAPARGTGGDVVL